MKRSSVPRVAGVEPDARLVRAVVDSPVGPLELLATDAGLRALSFGVDASDRNRTVVGPVVGPVVDDASHPVLAAAIGQLDEYFAGTRREFDLRLDPHGTPFQLQAWQALRTIPFGATISYGEQARRVGDARKARAVGSANGRNPISVIVPCHRVIGADGSLTGFGGGLEAKSWLLDHERRVLAADAR